MSAETGVGPSMASGSQMWSGNIADLPAPPTKQSARPHASTEPPRKVRPAAEATAGACGSHSTSNPKLPVQYDSVRMPNRKPKSAKRVTMKAFFEAATAAGFV